MIANLHCLSPYYLYLTDMTSSQRLLYIPEWIHVKTRVGSEVTCPAGAVPPEVHLKKEME